MKRISLVAAAALLVLGTKAHAQARKDTTARKSAAVATAAAKTADKAASKATMDAKAASKAATSAKQEAHRLARMVPGVRFFILETVGAVEKIDVQFTALRPDYEPDVYDADRDIPF